MPLVVNSPTPMKTPTAKTSSPRLSPGSRPGNSTVISLLFGDIFPVGELTRNACCSLSGPLVFRLLKLCEPYVPRRLIFSISEAAATFHQSDGVRERSLRSPR